VCVCVSVWVGGWVGGWVFVCVCTYRTEVIKECHRLHAVRYLEVCATSYNSPSSSIQISVAVEVCNVIEFSSLHLWLLYFSPLLHLVS
jgi:hypothetical protein